MFSCPVCYFNQMPDPPQDYNICPCCGTEFGYDDEFKTFAQLRADWINAGMQWFFRQPPLFWSPVLQLALNPFSGEPFAYAHAGLTVSSVLSIYGFAESPAPVFEGAPLYPIGNTYQAIDVLTYSHPGFDIAASAVVATGDENQQYEVIADVEDFELELAS
jgi:hypothetical protein